MGFSSSGGGVPGDSGAYIAQDNTTNGSADTLTAHTLNKFYSTWFIRVTGASDVLFRFPEGSGNDFITIKAGTERTFRLVASGWDEKSGGTSITYSIFAIE